MCSGLYGTGLPVSSNPVTIHCSRTASEYVWFGAPASRSTLFRRALTGTVGSPTRCPMCPNSMVMDRLGQNLYFGSSRELMIYAAGSNTLTKRTHPFLAWYWLSRRTTQRSSSTTRSARSSISTAPPEGYRATFGGRWQCAAWTPDGQTLYITDNAALNDSNQGINHAHGHVVRFIA